MADQVKVGILLPTREAVMSGHPEAAPLLALADRAEASGFDSVWVGDSLTARPRHEPLTLLAAVAGRTRRVLLGTAVLLPALRHPLLLAHAVATLDRISEGRFILGVGVATDAPPVRKEFESAGIPFGERVGRLTEGLELCRRLWSIRGASDRVAFSGKYFSVDRIQVLPTPHASGGPPIWMGGSSEGACNRAGAWSDGWFPNPPTPAAFRQGWARVRDAARAAGRPESAVAPAVYVTINVNDDVAQAQAEMRRFAEGYYGVPYEVTAARQGCYAGPAGGCLEWLAGFVEAGARHLVLRFASPDQTGQLARATESILPRLAAA